MPADRATEAEVAAVLGALRERPADLLHDVLAGPADEALGAAYAAARLYREANRVTLGLLHDTRQELARERQRRFDLINEMRRGRTVRVTA